MHLKKKIYLLMKNTAIILHFNEIMWIVSL